MNSDHDTTLEFVSRRQFMALTGGSLALAGLGGCTVQPPAEPILPYVRAPEEIVPGRPLFFATAMTHCGFATGLLVESHEGRPTKIEGNPDHPASLGATDAFAQASILTLYDPDRSQTVTHQGAIHSWDDAVHAIRAALVALRERKGEGLRVLTETVTSPTLAGQMEKLLKLFPKAKWHQYEPAGRDMAREGARLAFGGYAHTHYRFDQADVVLSLDADFLADGPGHLRYVHDFMSRRQPPLLQKAEGGSWTPSRLYVVECTPTLTGAKADHRWAARPSTVEPLARAIAARLDERLKTVVEAADASASLAIPEPALAALVRDLQQHRGASIVVAGDRQPAAVHALAHAMNHSLGNAGKTVLHTDPIEARPMDQMNSLRELVNHMERGQVQLMLILGGNPVYSTPADLDFAGHLNQVPLRIHLGLYADETAALCHWHIPEAHYLESWSDARAYDGTASIVQPLIAPLYGGKSAHELLTLFTEPAERPGYAVVRDHWREWWQQQKIAGEFEDFWMTSLHDGVVAGTVFAAKEVELQKGWAESLTKGAIAKEPMHGVEIAFRPDPSVHDGRYANNAWLQELPKSLTKLTWDNAALLSPATAERLGLKSHVGGHGGEHGEVIVDVIDLSYRGRTLRTPAWVVPGHADDAVTLFFGHGRTRTGRTGNGVGVNAYRLQTADAPWFGAGLEVHRAAETYRLACTQFHHNMEGRDLIRIGTFAGSVANSHNEGHKKRIPLTMYDEAEHPYDGYKWGMAIDLTACIGCNACVVACQAENNIPTVGKEQVLRGREMHWLRIDTYQEHGETYFQPVPCMHCENAPCELVCPVGATAHSDEGLNDMVYNRCVGTRYCSNNCPYKVRRFNFLQYSDYATASLKLLRNPDVTVRTRGVMEKCTYCVQRINQARIQAEKEDRRIQDGEILTACQAVCPAQAIAFGDLNDPKSKVVRWKAAPRNYGLLAELNTRPRTTYLADLRNPNAGLMSGE